MLLDRYSCSWSDEVLEEIGGVDGVEGVKSGWTVDFESLRQVCRLKFYFLLFEKNAYFATFDQIDNVIDICNHREMSRLKIESIN